MQKTIAILIAFSFIAAAVPARAAVPAGSLVRGSQPAVYYVTGAGQRMAFPNSATYFSWYADFNGVQFISDTELARLPLSKNVTYRPGVRLLKVPSAPTVYAVSSGGVLRPLGSESVARALYGADWMRLISDLPESFFVNYRMGGTIVGINDYSPSNERAFAFAPSDEATTTTTTTTTTTSFTSLSQGPTDTAGRVQTIVVDPGNDSVAYVGTASGGIFKTTDRGMNWQSVGGALASTHISVLVVDPRATGTVYAGTGEIYTPGDAYGFAGVLVSRDSGTSWSVLGTSATLPLRAVSAIAVHPSDSNRLFIAGDAGIYETTNAGATWVKRADGFIQNLVISKHNASIIMATASGTIVLRSTDGGVNWKNLAGFNNTHGLPDNNPWFTRVTVSESIGKTVTPNIDSIWYVVMTEPFRMYRSINDGDTWQDAGRQPYDGSARNYVVAPDPSNADVVYTAGSTLHRSEDSGFLVTTMPFPAPELRAFTFAPSNPAIVYAGTDNGVAVSTNGGLSWNMRNHGLTNTQWYGLAVGSDGRIYGAVQDYSFLTVRNGVVTQGPWGEARSIVTDPTNARRVYVLAADKGVGRSLDSGVLFAPAGGNLPNAGTLTALTHDLVDGSTLYIASGTKLYWTTDAGDNWYLIGDGGSSANITSIFAEGGIRRAVFVGRTDGTVQMVTGVRAPSRVWKTIYTEPNKKPVADLAGVTGALTIGFNTDWGTRVVRLTESGSAWQPVDLTSNLSAGAWVRTLSMSADNQNILYVGTLGGVFAGTSTDGRTFSWQRINDLPSVEVMDVVAAGQGTAYVATWGRGFYKIQK